MYATDLNTTPVIAVPQPARDNPAAGTTGNPSPVAVRVPSTGGLSVPAGVVVWSVGGLAVTFLVRAIFSKGGLG